MVALALTTPSRRAVAGARAKRRGDDAEAIVERLHDSWGFRTRNPGAHLTRRHARTIVVSGKARNIGTQGPDFGGGAPAALWGRIGRAEWVEVEVKAVDPDVMRRLPFDRFTDAEVETLSACAKAGGVAIVLVLYGPLVAPRWCAVPWSCLEERVRDWRCRVVDAPASIVESDLLAHACPPLEYLRTGGRW